MRQGEGKWGVKWGFGLDLSRGWFHAKRTASAKIDGPATKLALPSVSEHVSVGRYRHELWPLEVEQQQDSVSPLLLLVRPLLVCCRRHPSTWYMVDDMPIYPSCRSQMLGREVGNVALGTLTGPLLVQKAIGCLDSWLGLFRSLWRRRWIFGTLSSASHWAPPLPNWVLYSLELDNVAMKYNDDDSGVWYNRSYKLCGSLWRAKRENRLFWPITWRRRAFFCEIEDKRYVRSHVPRSLYYNITLGIGIGKYGSATM